jgi:hypothetical protein
MWRDTVPTLDIMRRLETGTSEFNHPIENADADVRFCLVDFEVPRLPFRPDCDLPSAHLRLHAAALSIAGGLLSSYPTTGLYPGDVTVANRWVQLRLAAGNGVLRRRDNDRNYLAKARLRKITGWQTIMGPFSHKFGNCAVDLVQEAGQSQAIVGAIRCEISTDNLTRGEVKTKVKLTSSFAFGLGVMLFLEPPAFTEDLQVDEELTLKLQAPERNCRSGRSDRFWGGKPEPNRK